MKRLSLRAPSAPRALALTLLGVSLAAGTYADRVPDAPPPIIDGRHVVAADLHVHSFLGDGTLPPWNLGREARRRGLDVIAITNHNQNFAARLGHAFYPRLGGSSALVLAGEEVTHPGYHIVGVGLHEAVDWRRPPIEVAAAIHAQGGLAIAAHPARAYWGSYDDATLRVLDGIEVAHPIVYRTNTPDLLTFFARANQVRAAANQPPLAAIGSSDFHTHAILGRCRTFVFARELSEAGVLAAIKEGATVAALEGVVPPGYTRAIPPPPRARIFGILGWLGLVLLLVVAPGPRPGRAPR
jgi:predicted metal-dependent phosphoesterase TrpH